MSNRRIFHLLLIVCAIAHVKPSMVNACICTAPPPVDQAMADAEIVFMGTVIAQEEEDPFASPGEFRRINLQVETSWKGVSGTTAGVETPAGGAACGISSDVGQTLVVYGMRLESSGRIVVTLCSRTGLLGGALEDTETLDELGIAPIELSDGPDPTFAPFDLEDGNGNDEPSDGATHDGEDVPDGSSNVGRRSGPPIGVCGTAASMTPLAAVGLLRCYFHIRRRTNRSETLQR